ncbi:MAG: transglutaminase domain-containing protein [Clostridiales bacterium]|nr:transglutaminase domain-containing protein [Clostridiales bacterium]
MKKLNFSYEVEYSFSQPVTDHCYALRILPETNEEQGIYASEYKISGGNSCLENGDEVWEVSEGCGSVTGRDGFGNPLIVGRLEVPHDYFRFSVTGSGYIDRSGKGKSAESVSPVYRFPTDLTRPGDELRRFFAANQEMVQGLSKGSRDRVMAWMHLLMENFSYFSGVTGIHTTAEEALKGGSGVCQDYAHILLALLRMDGIPARYVAGMMIGEGATHAWCEAWCEGSWVSIDPTHDRKCDDNYIEVARGRDYRDCIMDRGCFKGYALQTQTVRVSVQEAQSIPVGRWRLGV